MKLPGKAFLFISAFLILLAAFQFVFNTKYSFPDPSVFRGDRLYNPYSGMDSTKWKRSNFHLHTRSWLGITAGSANSTQVSDTFYKYFGYDISCISDYMKIDTSGRHNKIYIPVYEHGYMFFKTHQIVINAKKTCWTDYFFYQTLNDKQHIINRLKSDSSTLVAIVHPALRNAYRYSDLKYLGNYDCIEIVNSRDSFVKYYDQALSAGHKVFILADDDAHNLAKINQGAHCFTVINGDPERNSILKALKTGKSYGVRFNLQPYKSNYQKREALKRLPVIKEVNTNHDTLSVRTDLPVDTVRFIGQGGSLRKTSLNCSKGFYVFSRDDTYIRAEIVCKDGTVYYLNPVFRYHGSPLAENAPVVNTFGTDASRISFAFVFFLTLYYTRRSADRLPLKTGI